MTEQRRPNKPSRAPPKSLRDLLGKVVADSFARRGFASAELVTRWADIVGAEIAAHSEPMKMLWPRPAAGEDSEPGTLVLRVEGPTAVEIQHLENVICERVNRFLGWNAVGHIRLRQAPLRRVAGEAVRAPDPAAIAGLAATLSDVADEDLRQALARLGAAVKRG